MSKYNSYEGSCLLAEVFDEFPLHGADLLPRQLRHGTAAAPRAVVPHPLQGLRVDLDEQRHLLAFLERAPRAAAA